MNRILPLLLFASLATAQWPTPKTAMEAYDFVQDRRSAAEKLWEKEDPAGIAMLLATLPYLDQPLVRDLSAGNRYLAARRLNIDIDLAQAHALQGNKGKAFEYLRKVVAEAPIPSLADYFARDKAFDSLNADPEFATILSGFRVFDPLWDSPALKTLYQDNLSDAEKIAGLSKFWSEVKYNFGFPEKLVALNWDQMYLDWIPRVLATKSTTDYYRELMLLCARLSDGHTNVYAPPQSDINAKPPLRTGFIEGRVVIQEVRSPTLEARGVRAGMEIVAVDGEPARDYARRQVEPYQSASTQQDRENRTYWYGFLRGPSAKPVRLTLQDAGGKRSEVELARSGYTDVRNVPPFEWRMLEDNVAYVALNSFENGQVVNQWQKAFPEISKSSAIILDLRINGSGGRCFTGIGFQILRDLAATPFLGSRERERRYDPTDRARGTLMEFIDISQPDSIQPRPGGYTSKPVVVLASAATFLRRKIFLVAWKNSGRGKIIGGAEWRQHRTTSFVHAAWRRHCSGVYKEGIPSPDGANEWVGKGIDPDILVHPALTDVQAGKDTVLNRAVALVRSALSN